MNYNQQWGNNQQHGRCHRMRVRGRGWRGPGFPRGGPRGPPRGGFRGPPPDFRFPNNPPWPRLPNLPPYMPGPGPMPGPDPVPLFRRPFLSPPRSRASPPPRPPSPLPGSEEYMQRDISEKSAFLKRELELEGPDTSNLGATSDEKLSEFMCDSPCTSFNDNVDTKNRPIQQLVVTEEKASSPRRNKRQTQRQAQQPESNMSVEEIHDKIMNHISNLSLGKKMNLVNQARTTGYDIAIQQITRQKRLELSKALRDMCNNKFKETGSSSEVINAIIPDFDIKIEELPRELVEQLSTTLNEDIQERIQMCIDPEVMFQQAADMLSSTTIEEVNINDSELLFTQTGEMLNIAQDDDNNINESVSASVPDDIECGFPNFGNSTLDANISQNIEDSTLGFNAQIGCTGFLFDETIPPPAIINLPDQQRHTSSASLGIPSLMSLPLRPPVQYPLQTCSPLHPTSYPPPPQNFQFPTEFSNLDSSHIHPNNKIDPVLLPEASVDNKQYYSPGHESSNSPLDTPVVDDLIIGQSLCAEPPDIPTLVGDVLTNACDNDQINMIGDQESGQYCDVNPEINDILLPSSVPISEPNLPSNPDEISSAMDLPPVDITTKIENYESDVMAEAAELEACLAQSDLDLKLLGLKQPSALNETSKVKSQLPKSNAKLKSNSTKKLRLRRGPIIKQQDASEPSTSKSENEDKDSENKVNVQNPVRQTFEPMKFVKKSISIKRPLKLNRSLEVTNSNKNAAKQPKESKIEKDQKHHPAKMEETVKPSQISNDNPAKMEETVKPSQVSKDHPAKMEETVIASQVPKKSSKNVDNKEKRLQKFLSSTSNIKETLPEKFLEKASPVVETDKTPKSKDSKSRSTSIEIEVIFEDKLPQKEKRKQEVSKEDLSRRKEKKSKEPYEEEPSKADLYIKSRNERSRHDVYQAQKYEEEYNRKYKEKPLSVDEERYNRRSDSDRSFEKYYEKVRSSDSEQSETPRFSKYTSEREDERYSRRYHHDAYLHRGEYTNFDANYSYEKQRYRYSPQYYSRLESSHPAEQYNRYTHHRRRKHEELHKRKKNKRHRDNSYSSGGNSDKDSPGASSRRKHKYKTSLAMKAIKQTHKKFPAKQIDILHKFTSSHRKRDSSSNSGDSDSSSSSEFDENRKIKSEPASPERALPEKRARSVDRFMERTSNRVATKEIENKTSSSSPKQLTDQRPVTPSRLNKSLEPQFELIIPFANKPCPEITSANKQSASPDISFMNKPSPSDKLKETLTQIVPFANKPCPEITSASKQSASPDISFMNKPSPSDKLKETMTQIVPFANKPCPEVTNQLQQSASPVTAFTNNPSPSNKLQEPLTPIVPFANKPCPSRNKVKNPEKKREEMIMSANKVSFRGSNKKSLPEEESKTEKKQNLAVKELPNIDNIAKIISNLSTIVQTTDVEEKTPAVDVHVSLAVDVEPISKKSQEKKEPEESKKCNQRPWKSPGEKKFMMEQLNINPTTDEIDGKVSISVSRTDSTDTNELYIDKTIEDEKLSFINPDPDTAKSVSSFPAIEGDIETNASKDLADQKIIQSQEESNSNLDSNKQMGGDKNNLQTLLNVTIPTEIIPNLNKEESDLKQTLAIENEIVLENLKESQAIQMQPEKSLELVLQSEPMQSEEFELVPQSKPMQSEEFELVPQSKPMQSEESRTSLEKPEIETNKHNKIKTESKDHRRSVKNKTSHRKSRSKSIPRESELVHSAEVSSTSDAAKSKASTSGSTSKAKSKPKTPTPISNNEIKNETVTLPEKEHLPSNAISEMKSSQVVDEKMLVTTYTQTEADASDNTRIKHRKSSKKDKHSKSDKVKSTTVSTQTFSANVCNSTQTPSAKCKSIQVQVGTEQKSAKKIALVQTDSVVIIGSVNETDSSDKLEDKSSRKILKAVRRKEAVQRMIDLDTEIERLTKLRQSLYQNLNYDSGSDECDSSSVASRNQETVVPNEHLTDREKRKRKLNTNLKQSVENKSNEPAEKKRAIQTAVNKQAKTSKEAKHSSNSETATTTSKTEKSRVHKQKTSIVEKISTTEDNSGLRKTESSERDSKSQSVMNGENMKSAGEGKHAKNTEVKNEANTSLKENKIKTDVESKTEKLQNDEKDLSIKVEVNYQLKIENKTMSIEQHTEAKASNITPEIEHVGKPKRSKQKKSETKLTNEDSREAKKEQTKAENISEEPVGKVVDTELLSTTTKDNKKKEPRASEIKREDSAGRDTSTDSESRKTRKRKEQEKIISEENVEKGATTEPTPRGSKELKRKDQKASESEAKPEEYTRRDPSNELESRRTRQKNEPKKISSEATREESTGRNADIEPTTSGTRVLRNKGPKDIQSDVKEESMRPDRKSRESKRKERKRIASETEHSESTKNEQSTGRDTSAEQVLKGRRSEEMSETKPKESSEAKPEESTRRDPSNESESRRTRQKNELKKILSEATREESTGRNSTTEPTISDTRTLRNKGPKDIQSDLKEESMKPNRKSRESRRKERKRIASETEQGEFPKNEQCAGRDTSAEQVLKGRRSEEMSETKQEESSEAKPETSTGREPSTEPESRRTRQKNEQRTLSPAATREESTGRSTSTEPPSRDTRTLRRKEIEDVQSDVREESLSRDQTSRESRKVEQKKIILETEQGELPKTEQSTRRDTSAEQDSEQRKGEQTSETKQEESSKKDTSTESSCGNITEMDRNEQKQIESEAKQEESVGTEQALRKSGRNERETDTECGESTERDTSTETTSKERRKMRRKETKDMLRKKERKKAKSRIKGEELIDRDNSMEPSPEHAKKSKKKSHRSKSSKRSKRERPIIKIKIKPPVQPDSKSGSYEKISENESPPIKLRKITEPSSSDIQKTIDSVAKNETGTASPKLRKREKAGGDDSGSKNKARKSRRLSDRQSIESKEFNTAEETADTQKNELDQQEDSGFLGFNSSESKQTTEDDAMSDKLNGSLDGDFQERPPNKKEKKRKRIDIELDPAIDSQNLLLVQSTKRTKLTDFYPDGDHMGTVPKKKPKRYPFSGVKSNYKSKKRKPSFSDGSHRSSSPRSRSSKSEKLPCSLGANTMVRMTRYSLQQLEQMRDNIRKSRPEISEDSSIESTIENVNVIDHIEPISESTDKRTEAVEEVAGMTSNLESNDEGSEEKCNVNVDEQSDNPFEMKEPTDGNMINATVHSETTAECEQHLRPTDNQTEATDINIKEETLSVTSGTMAPELEANIDILPHLETSNEEFEDFVKESMCESKDIDVEPPVLSPQFEEIGGTKKDCEILEVLDEDDDFTMDFKGFTGAILVIKVIAATALAASDKGKLFCFNMLNGELIYNFEMSKLAITSMVIIKKKEEYMVYTGSLDSCVGVLNFSAKEVVKQEKTVEPVQCMEHAWNYIFIGSDRGSLIRFNLNGEKVDDVIKISDFNVLMIKATQEGPRKVLVIATRNAPVCIRDALSGLLLRTMETPFSPTVYTLLFDKNLIYCGTSQHDILVYTFEDGQLIFKHEATKSKGVVCMQIVGNLLFAGCYNGNIYVYNTKTNIHLGTMNGPGGLMLSMEIVHNKIIVGTKSSNFRAWRIPQEYLDQM